MNDNLLFLAFATIFGVAMLIVGATIGYFGGRRDEQSERVNRRIVRYGGRDAMDRPFLDG